MCSSNASLSNGSKMCSILDTRKLVSQIQSGTIQPNRLLKTSYSKGWPTGLLTLKRKIIWSKGRNRKSSRMKGMKIWIRENSPSKLCTRINTWIHCCPLWNPRWNSTQFRPKYRCRERWPKCFWKRRRIRRSTIPRTRRGGIWKGSRTGAICPWSGQQGRACSKRTMPPSFSNEITYILSEYKNHWSQMSY